MKRTVNICGIVILLAILIGAATMEYDIKIYTPEWLRKCKNFVNHAEKG